MATSRVRMFADPNGSGKSDLICRLQHSDLPLGPIVNADQTLAKLERSGFIDLKPFKLSDITRDDWNASVNGIDELSSRVKKAGKVPSVDIKEDMLVCDDELNAYTAALISDFIRYMMLDQEISFSFEMVMSHPGKINFLQVAQKKDLKRIFTLLLRMILLSM